MDAKIVKGLTDSLYWALHWIEVNCIEPSAHFEPSNRELYEQAWRNVRLGDSITKEQSRVDKNWPVKCQCGKAYQTQEGWDAQGLVEDLPSGNELHHNLNEPCKVVPPNPCNGCQGSLSGCESCGAKKE